MKNLFKKKVEKAKVFLQVWFPDVEFSEWEIYKTAKLLPIRVLNWKRKAG